MSKWFMLILLLPTLALAGEYFDINRSTRTTATVNVIWYTTQKEVDEECARLRVEKATGEILACYNIPTSTIYMVEPKSFNDLHRLLLLGHEFWHALGAEHT